MHLCDFEREFVKRAEKTGLDYELRPAATAEQIETAQCRLAVTFHEQIRRFYSFCNGFVVREPHFEICSLEQMEFMEPHLLHFCTVDRCHLLCFDTSSLNDAGQWFVVNPETGFRVTYTMASIWSNKVWIWIDWGRPVWGP